MRGWLWKDDMQGRGPGQHKKQLHVKMSLCMAQTTWLVRCTPSLAHQSNASTILLPASDCMPSFQPMPFILPLHGLPAPTCMSPHSSWLAANWLSPTTSPSPSPTWRARCATSLGANR